jgi:hypothetical protein
MQNNRSHSTHAVHGCIQNILHRTTMAVGLGYQQGKATERPPCLTLFGSITTAASYSPAVVCYGFITLRRLSAALHFTPDSPELLTVEAKPCLCTLQRLILFLVFSFYTSVSTGKSDVTRGKTSFDNLGRLACAAAGLQV